MGSNLSADTSRPARLSACLIVKNEERRLPACLAGVAFCDEIVVVDSGSTDRTMQIARAAGATVIEHPWAGYPAQRNVALEAAHGEWALEVDADERVTPPLRAQIEELVSNPPNDVDNAVIPLRQIFLGARLGPSAGYPAGRVRLVRRARYRHNEHRAVHEGLWPVGRSAYLDGDLEHVLSESLRESIRDLWNYTRLESEHVDVGGAGRAINGIVLRPSIKLLYRAVLLGGWRDRLPGFTKIALDCAYDSLTWTRAVDSRWRSRRRADQSAGRPGAPDERHFGHAIGYRGPARIAVIARGRRQAAAARTWLEAPVHEGADGVLITDAVCRSATFRTLQLPRFGPLLALRALYGEETRNPIEALVCPGRFVRAICGFVPGPLRGFAPPVSLAGSPRELLDGIVARRPSP